MEETKKRVAVIGQKLSDHVRNEEIGNTKRDACIDQLFAAVNEIMSNHLPHIQSRLDRIELQLGVLVKMMWFLVSVAVCGAGFLIEQFIRFLMAQ